MVTTQSTTTYPSNLVLVTADSIAEDIVALNRMMSRGVISEKDYERAKKTLLNRIGMSVNPQAQETTTAGLLEQIETLHQMQSGQLITEKEYQKQKKKLLALI
jgi:membrane peptidoglycan carboxypeptidase